ncbi:hypothetical protein LOAG_16293, partial [Loa loa]
MSLAFNRVEFWWFILFVFIFVFELFFRYFLVEFKGKFFMDHYARFIYKLIPNFFYFDFAILGINYFFFGVFRFFSFVLFSLFRGYYHFGVLMVFFFYIIFCVFLVCFSSISISFIIFNFRLKDLILLIGFF